MSTADATGGAVLEEIAEMIREVIGEEWVRETEIGRETRFGADLELESIEMVALGERIQGRWPSVDFVAWLSRLSLDDLVGLRVGDLADYIAACL